MIKFTLPNDRIRKRGFFLALLAFSLGSTIAQGQEALETPPARVLTLQDCISIALQESPLLDSSRLDVAAATEDVRAAHAKLLPNLSGTYSPQLFSGSSINKFGIVNLGNAGSIVVSPDKTSSVDLGKVQVFSAQLAYPIFQDGSFLGLGRPPTVASKQAQKRNLAWTFQLRRSEIVERITDSYITTVSAINRTSYARRRVKLLELLVAITKEQQRQGLTLPIDLKVAQSQLEGARSLSKILGEQAVAGSIELSRALGMDSPDELHLSTTLPNPPEPPSAAVLLGSALNQHPSLQMQRAVIDQAKADYKLERYRLYPSVNFDGSAIHIDDFGSSGAEAYVAYLSVHIPLYDFGAQIATTRSKLLKYKAERARLLSVADDLTYEVVKTYQEIYVLSQNILSLQAEVAKADRDLQVTSSQQQQGIAPPLTAIEKELAYIAKKDDLDGIEVRRLILYSALQKAAGGSWQWQR
jgi:outer membrane protein TolC